MREKGKRWVCQGVAQLEKGFRYVIVKHLRARGRNSALPLNILKKKKNFTAA